MLLTIGEKLLPSENPKNTFEFEVVFMLGDADYDGTSTVRIHENHPKLDDFVKFLEENRKKSKQYYYTELTEEFKSFTGDWDDYEGEYDEIDNPTPETPIMLDWFSKDGEYYGSVTLWRAIYYNENGEKFITSLKDNTLGGGI